MPHPNFFGFWARPPGSCPDGPRQPAVLRADHATVHLRFRAAPHLGFEHDFGRIAPPLSDRCQPAPERGRGGFRIGRTQPHGIAGHHGLAAVPIFNFTPAKVAPLFRARRRKATQPARERPREAKAALPGCFDYRRPEPRRFRIMSTDWGRALQDRPAETSETTKQSNSRNVSLVSLVSPGSRAGRRDFVSMSRLSRPSFGWRGQGGVAWSGGMFMDFFLGDANTIFCFVVSSLVGFCLSAFVCFFWFLGVVFGSGHPNSLSSPQ